MQRSLMTLATLTVLVTSPMIAHAVQKDDTVQQKPPPEQRIDETSPDLRDSLTIEKTVERAPESAQPQDPDGNKRVWQPPAPPTRR